MLLFALTQTLEQSKTTLQQITDTFLNRQSIETLIIALVAALLVGRIIATILRRVTRIIGRGIDRTEDLGIVTKLRRTETILVLSIAMIRLLLVVGAIIFWWILNHPGNKPGAILGLGAGAIITIIFSNALSPILRDIACGAVMMAEHWYAVGDHVTIDPLNEAQGIVERVTLRSTRIRGVNGEIIWINNQSIMAVRVAPKGVRTLAFEIFVSDLEKGEALIEETNARLPIGALVVVSPLNIMTVTKVGDQIWHITALCEVAPGREWLLERFALEVMQELDKNHKILVHTPITRYADSEAERRYATSIRNSHKPRIARHGGVIKKTRPKKSKKS